MAMYQPIPSLPVDYIATGTIRNIGLLPEKQLQMIKAYESHCPKSTANINRETLPW